MIVMKKHILLMISIFFIGLNFVYAKDTVKLSKCVDGDTIKVILNNTEYTIRMLSIDTPESVKPNTNIEYYGKEASEYTCNRLKKAKKIVLEYDPNSDKFDKYDRILAWVFVDDKLLQEELVELGYAKVAYLYNDYKYVDILKEKQELASAKNIGIWNEEAKNNFEKTLSTDITVSTKDYTDVEVIFLVIIFLVISLISKITSKISHKKH